MKNLSPETIKQFTEAMKRPEGTVAFTCTFNNDLFNENIAGGKIFEIVSGKHYFLLERTDNFEVKFYYSSPGTGTRVATINLNTVLPSKKVFFCFVWSPKETRLSIGPRDAEGKELVTAEGKKSQKKFQVGENGQVFQIGDEGIEVIGTRINIETKQIIKPAAIDVWNETKKAIEILLTGKSQEGFIFETVKANLSIAMMVTGFEAYCKTRLQEIEAEGINPDFKQIHEKTRLSKEQLFKSSSNYFQDINGYCKKIYALGLGIKFGNLLDSNEWGRLIQLFKFRHRIVHASPMISMINEFEIPKELPLFSANIINEALGLFDKFISKLHKKTLNLKKQ